MDEQPVILFVAIDEPPIGVVAEIEGRGLKVAVCSLADAEESIASHAPLLVVLSGARGASELSTLLEDQPEASRVQVLILAARRELARLMGLNRDIVVALLAVEMGDATLASRIDALARQAARRRGVTLRSTAAVRASLHAMASVAATPTAAEPAPALDAPAPAIVAPAVPIAFAAPLLSGAPTPEVRVAPAGSRDLAPAPAPPPRGTALGMPAAPRQKLDAPAPPDVLTGAGQRPESLSPEDYLSAAPVAQERKASAFDPGALLRDTGLEREAGALSSALAHTPILGQDTQVSAVAVEPVVTGAVAISPADLLPGEKVVDVDESELTDVLDSDEGMRVLEAGSNESSVEELGAAELESLAPDALDSDADLPSVGGAPAPPIFDETELPLVRPRSTPPTAPGPGALEASPPPLPVAHGAFSPPAPPDSLAPDPEQPRAFERGADEAIDPGARSSAFANPPPPPEGPQGPALRVPSVGPVPAGLEFERSSSKRPLAILGGLGALLALVVGGYLLTQKGRARPVPTTVASETAPAPRAPSGDAEAAVVAGREVPSATASSGAAELAMATSTEAVEGGAPPAPPGAASSDAPAAAPATPSESGATPKAAAQAGLDERFVVENPWKIPETPLPSCDELAPGVTATSADRVAEASPHWAEARRLIVKGDARGAAAAMCRAVAINPESPALEGLTSLYVMSGSPTLAVGFANRALAVRPTDRETKNLRGDAFSQLGRADEALADWLAAIGLRSDEAVRRAAESKNYVLEAKRAERRGDLPKAAQYFRRAVGLDPKNIMATSGLAGLLLRQEHLEQAATFAVYALREFELLPDAHVVLGDVSARKGDAAGARRAYQRALSIRPDYWDAEVKLRALDN